MRILFGRLRVVLLVGAFLATLGGCDLLEQDQGYSGARTQHCYILYDSVGQGTRYCVDVP